MQKTATERDTTFFSFACLPALLFAGEGMLSAGVKALPYPLPENADLFDVSGIGVGTAGAAG